MKSVKKLAEVADKLEQKLAKYAQQAIITQTGTTELFFGDENKQRAYNAAIQSGALAKYLTDWATKTQKTAAFDLKAVADPSKGARWVLTTNPPTLQGPVAKLLDAELRKVTGKGMVEAQKSADAAAKSGGGSGSLQVGSFAAEMD